MNGEIKKILMDFKTYFDGMDETGLIHNFLKQSLTKIAEQAISACVPERFREITEYERTHREERLDYYAKQNGYDKCRQDMQKNKSNYLKK